MFNLDSFQSQISVAGATVFVVSYYMTNDFRTAAIITGSHAIAHMLAMKQK
jgi:hypothetical protein